jgi:hypothetical protein
MSYQHYSLYEPTGKKGQIISYVYEGDLVDGARHGLGKLKTESGDYEGEFENGKPSGSGKFNSAKKIFSYRGEFLNGQMNGLGVIIFTDTDLKITGKFNSGLPYGVLWWETKDKISLGRSDGFSPKGFHVTERKDGSSSYSLFEQGKKIDEWVISDRAFSRRDAQAEKSDSNWKFIDLTEENIHFIKPNSIEKDGVQRTYWSLTTYLTPIGSRRALSTVSKVQIKCDSKSARILFVYWYADRNGGGSGAGDDLLENRHPDSHWSPIPPDSELNSEQEFVCR